MDNVKKNCTLLARRSPLQDLPDFLEKMSPTMIEMGKALRGTEEISDEHLIKWGSAIQKGTKVFAK